MLHNQAQAATAVLMLSPVSAANTAAATSGWIDVRAAEGDLLITVQNGALTGSCTWTVEHATDGSGTGGAAITPNEGAFSAATANSCQKRTVSASAVGGWIRVVGTIFTGPTLVAANVKYHPKTA